MTPHAKHAEKIKIYSMRQQPGETFLEFVSSVREKARNKGLDEEALVAICLAGANPEIRAHLTMGKPTNFKELLDLPIARDEKLGERNASDFTGIINELKSLKDTVQNSNKKVGFQDDEGKHHSRSSSADRFRSRRSRTVSPVVDMSGGEYLGSRRVNYPREELMVISDMGVRSDNQYRAKPGQKCTKCGNFSMCYTNQMMCPAYQKKCYICGKFNHFASVCMFRGKSSYSPGLMRAERSNVRYHPYNQSSNSVQGGFSSFRGGQRGRPFNQFQSNTFRQNFNNNRRGNFSGYGRGFMGNNFGNNRPMNGGFNRRSGNYSN